MVLALFYSATSCRCIDVFEINSRNVVVGRPPRTMAQTIVRRLSLGAQPAPLISLSRLSVPPCHRKSFEYEDAARLAVKQDTLGGEAQPAALCHAYSDDNIYEDIVCKSKILRHSDWRRRLIITVLSLCVFFEGSTRRWICCTRDKGRKSLTLLGAYCLNVQVWHKSHLEPILLPLQSLPGSTVFKTKKHRIIWGSVEPSTISCKTFS